MKSTSKTVLKRIVPLWLLVFLLKDMVGSTWSAKSLEWVWANISPCFIWYTFMNMVSSFLLLLTHSTVAPWRSVPQTLTKEEELKTFLKELKTQGEKWNALKLVVLGHGEVGKTTLIQAIKRSLDIRTRVSSLQPLPSPYPPPPPLPYPPLPSPPKKACLFVRDGFLIHLLKLITRLWTTSKHQKASNLWEVTGRSEWTCRRWSLPMEISRCGILAASLSMPSLTNSCSLLR